MKWLKKWLINTENFEDMFLDRDMYGFYMEKLKIEDEKLEELWKKDVPKLETILKKDGGKSELAFRKSDINIENVNFTQKLKIKHIPIKVSLEDDSITNFHNEAQKSVLMYGFVNTNQLNDWMQN